MGSRIEPLLTVAEAAEMLGVKPNTLRIWARDPHRGLTVYRPGRGPMFRASELLEWARRREEARQQKRPGRPPKKSNPFRRY